MERREGWTETLRFRLEDGRECVLSERCAYAAASQVNRVIWRYVAGDEERRAQLDMRCFYPQEMDLMLAHHGFDVVSKHGDFEGGRFGSESVRMVYVCKTV